MAENPLEELAKLVRSRTPPSAHQPEKVAVGDASAKTGAAALRLAPMREASQALLDLNAAFLLRDHEILMFMLGGK
jgi:hypothetical protein